MAKTNNKNKIIAGVCAGIIVTVAIVVAIIFAVNNNAINDSYFVSDDSKYVATLEEDASSDEEAIKIHYVYYYSGDKVTDAKYFYEFTSEDAATKGYNEFKDTVDESEYANIEQKGKYVILTAKASEYENMSASDAKSLIDFLNQTNEMDVEDNSDEAIVEEEVVEENIEETPSAE